MSSGKDQIQQKFNRANIRRKDLDDVPRSIQEYLQFMEYKIRKQIKSFTLLSICGNDRGHFIIQKNFQRAFSTMTLAERIDYYSNYVQTVQNATSKAQKISENGGDTSKEDVKIRQPISLRLKVGKQSKAFQEADVTIENQIVKTKNKGIPDINLSNYLIRKSKKKNEFCYALQSIRPSDINTIRFAFLSGEDQQKYLPEIRKQINDSTYNSIYRQIYEIITKRKTFPSQLQVKQLKLKNNNVPVTMEAPKKQNLQLTLEENALRNSRIPNLNKSVIEDIVKSREDQELDEELTELINEQNEEVEKQRKQVAKKVSLETPYFHQYKNIFKIMFPNYSLKQLTKLNHFGSIYSSKNSQLYIYTNVKDHLHQKMQLVIDLPLQVVCKAIYNVQLYKYWHPEINEGQTKLKISSENSCINYLKMKSYSEWYRERDFIFLMHMFRINQCYYIAAKSVENANFIPFQSITRGDLLHYIWKVEPEQTSTKNKPKCRVVVDIKADHEGHLNKTHQKELTQKFLRGFQQMQQFYSKHQNQKRLSELMGFHWTISQVQPNRNSIEYQQPDGGMSLRTCDFENASQISQNEEQNQVFYSIEDLSEQQKQQQQKQRQQKSQHEIKPEALQMNKSMMHSQVFGGNSADEQTIETNSEGLIILPKKYLKKKFTMVPFETAQKLMTFPYDNIVEKDHWIVEKSGGLKLINQVKIASQNNVLKFIMKTLKKNLFSGKGILNISLPVQIFNVDSNLQRICIAMSLGPQFLQTAAKSTDHLQRFKKVLAFGHSNSIIYFDVEKPFNPILGQTYQGYIRGCPIYAEQISHHPPVTSVLFIGRGYKVTGNLQAKVHVHVNSGDGINEGFYHVKFDDGHQIVFQTPPAQISGLAVGDRRFNFKNQGIYLDLKNLYFCQMKMEASGGLFGKKRQFSDQIEGSIVKIKPQFMRKFMDAKMDKKPSPSQGDIVQKIGQLSGRWPYNLKIDGVVYYDTHKNVPDKMIDEIYPLNSNSNYRQDLYYRKKNDLPRSQIQKQRLQVLQRGDRKFRQKFHGPAH